MFIRKTYNIELMTHDNVREHIERCPAVIIPLGGCEPFGRVGTLGTETDCVKRVADELSRRAKILRAPAIAFGCSAPFLSFAGTTAVKPRTFVNMLCEIIGGYVFQKVERVFLINAAPFNVDPCFEAIARLNKKFPHVEIKLFDLNAFGKSDFDRDDFLFLSLTGQYEKYLDEYKSSNIAIKKTLPADISAKYKTWKKRGRDPEKLRKLFSDALFVTDDYRAENNVTQNNIVQNNRAGNTAGQNVSHDNDTNTSDTILNDCVTKIFDTITAQVALSLGSNLGDRHNYINEMERELSKILADIKTSPLMETEPVGVCGDHPAYLNKIITGRYAGSIYKLLDTCQVIENALGRVRDKNTSSSKHKQHAPRTADIDILIFGDMVVDDDLLTIPHPEILNRRFIIEGLRAIDPSIIIPNKNSARKDLSDNNSPQTVGEHHKKLCAEVAAQKLSFVD